MTRLMFVRLKLPSPLPAAVWGRIDIRYFDFNAYFGHRARLHSTACHVLFARMKNKRNELLVNGLAKRATTLDCFGE